MVLSLYQPVRWTGKLRNEKWFHTCEYASKENDIIGFHAEKRQDNFSEFQNTYLHKLGQNSVYTPHEKQDIELLPHISVKNL